MCSESGALMRIIRVAAAGGLKILSSQALKILASRVFTGSINTRRGQQFIPRRRVKNPIEQGIQPIEVGQCVNRCFDRVARWTKPLAPWRNKISRSASARPSARPLPKMS